MYATATLVEHFTDHVCVILDREAAKTDPSSNVRVQLRALVDDGEITASEFAGAIHGLKRWMEDMPEGENPDAHAQLYYELLCGAGFTPPDVADVYRSQEVANDDE